MSAYRVGIDLGTSNTVVAYAAVGDDRIEVLPIEQLIAPGEVAARQLLPSLRYQCAPGEFADGALQLPWPSQPSAVHGSLARELGARLPGRLVASAKSWLSHAGVDRHAPILPWGGDEAVARVSPVEASAGYLAHVRAAWNARFVDAPLEQQEIVLTVPASFDEGARALTVEAARLAGLPSVRLLEEPQAAFHDWLSRHRERVASELSEVRLVLVCDVGGGTTDLTLIRVEPGEGGAGPRLTRIGVGDHLVLGGDNMDLAMAHLVEQRLGEARLSAARLSQLVQRCRGAKERLLAADAPDIASVTLLGAGSRLVGGARSVDLTRVEVERLVVDGFLPRCAPDARPQRRRSGIVEFGLPYPADAAITRHLAAFLMRHADAAREALGGSAPLGLPVPDALLLNGGVFRADALAARLAETLGDWRGGLPRILQNVEPDVAVARGAVAFALARSGVGPGIGGGSARSYFLVLDEGGQGRQAICVLPRGTEAGEQVALPARNFALQLGQAVRFHLVSSVSDQAWRPGELATLGGEDFVRLPPIAAVLPTPEGRSREKVTVSLVSTMTEVGTLEMHCISVDDARRRWLLPFDLRGGQAPPGEAAAATGSPGLGEAIGLIDRVFGSQSKQVGARDVRQLRGRLEGLLGKREQWDAALLRALFDALWQRARRRRRSAEHERIWLNLAGYCLRPGLGAPLDDWRIEQLWALFGQGLQYVSESRNWSEWWTLWRRAAGGLSEAQQLEVLEVLAGHLERLGSPRNASALQASYDDMVRLAASLEKVPVMHRIEVGKWLLERLRRPAEKPQTWWALGRVGARESLYGSAHNVVPPDVAGDWLEAVLAIDLRQVEPAAFAAAQIARLTGDRARDLPQPVRDKVARRLRAARAPQAWIDMVLEMRELEVADCLRVFGEALPAGLQLLEPADSALATSSI